ncbi:MAG: sulfatase-like hydrolase/transferase, partial [Pseudomonadota bacterium]
MSEKQKPTIPASEEENVQEPLSRRDLLVAGGAAATLGALPQGASSAPATQPRSGPYPPARKTTADRPFNVILFISDEEAYRLRPAEDYTTPAREELIRRGTTFHNHYIAAAMCTASRGVMFSGQPPQVNGLFDQMELGYVPSLKTTAPSMGTIFKKLGYATAYFGKFELRRDVITPSPQVNYSSALQEYGFDQFAPDGDKVGSPDQGYDTDVYTSGEAVRWLRSEAQALNEKGQPWLLVVSFVSPHDIMFADANQPGSNEQASAVGMRLTPPPDNAHFATKWKFAASPTQFQPLDAPGRPRAHLVYNIGWSAFLGEIPQDASAMWYTYYNYYLNLIRDNDRNIKQVIDAVTALDLWKSTVVFRTSDHGELGGAHGGLRGKGPLPYEQECHVPAVIVHPEHGGGRNCRALTSHIDLIPTLVGLTGVDSTSAEMALGSLPGNDFSRLLQEPESAEADAVREAALFNYVGMQTVDANYMARVCRELAHGRFAPHFNEVWPDLSGRGFVSFVFDGRYKFARYYAPDNLNTPRTIKDLLSQNEIELYDLRTDPNEVKNLAVDVDANRDLILRMND